MSGKDKDHRVKREFKIDKGRKSGAWTTIPVPYQDIETFAPGSRPPHLQSHMEGKHNILLFVTDDQGQDAGCYGNEVIQTPFLDSLASEGTVFVNAFATTASCSASRSVILSGKHNHATGQYGHAHSYHHFKSFENLNTLPVLLQKAGYRTASAGKFHVAPEPVYHFEEYIGGNHRNPVEMANHSKEFISQAGDQPFFLYFCTADPHRGGGYVEDLPEQPNRFGNQPEGYPGIVEVAYRPEDVVVPPFLPDNSVTRAELAQYYQAVSRIDQGLGRLVEILKEAGQYENTLIMYISDHGIAFPGAKTTVYDPGLQSPCVVRHPSVEQNGEVKSSFVSWTDIAPTLLDFAGVSHLEQLEMHGQSFLPLLEGDSANERQEVYASHTFHEVQMYYPMRVVRDTKYKLIWNMAYELPFPFASDLWAAPTWQYIYLKGPDAMYGIRTVDQYINRPEFEFFDIEEDPYETNNLAEDPRYTSLLEEYKEKIRRFQEKTQDPWILKWEYE